ncbi:MAG: hypothetical protein M0023_07980 [Desulfobacteraceae bacterium]|nr:hypothetical protein [Desulfobacteraceae bacterium]
MNVSSAAKYAFGVGQRQQVVVAGMHDQYAPPEGRHLFVLIETSVDRRPQIVTRRIDIVRMDITIFMSIFDSFSPVSAVRILSKQCAVAACN